jgi:protein involved in polysaccharide export with SLBB domain
MFVLLAALASAGATPLGAQQDASAISRAAGARVEPGDRIFLKVWREPLFRDTVMVNEHGEIVLPKIGRLTVSSLTISELRDTVVHRLRSFLRDPAADVTVLRRVAVNGEVMRPGVYMVDIATTLRDAVALAGGVTMFGNTQKVSIVRNGEVIRVPDWSRDTSPVSDLRSGDQVVVGRRNWLVLNLASAATAAGVIATLIIALTR